MSEKKYQLTDETYTYRRDLEDVCLHRIKALVDIPSSGVKKGELGGWVEGENNLSQEGDCWVFQEARVSGHAKVTQNARVAGHAVVCENATLQGSCFVSGHVYISGKCVVKGFVNVCGHAEVSGCAVITEHARVHGSAKISQNGVVEGHCEVTGAATVSGYALVNGNAFVGDNAVVRGHARVIERAFVGHSAVVSGSALVGGDSRVEGQALVTHVANVIGKVTVGGVTALYDGVVDSPSSFLTISPLTSLEIKLTYNHNTGTIGLRDGLVGSFAKEEAWCKEDDFYEKVVEKQELSAAEVDELKLALRTFSAAVEAARTTNSTEL